MKKSRFMKEKKRFLMIIFSILRRRLILWNHRRRLLNSIWLFYRKYLMIRSRGEMRILNFLNPGNQSARKKFMIMVNPETNSK